MSATRRLPRPVRAARNAAQRLYDTAVATERLTATLAPVTATLAPLPVEIAALRTRIDALEVQARDDRQAVLDAVNDHHAETFEILRLVHDDEPGNRQRLWRLRETEAYALAFEEPEPLVSICMATYNNTELLLERALPSVLAQTYERIEVVIVADGASPEVERAVSGMGDPRVRYASLTMRGPYPEAEKELWSVAGGPPGNEAMRLARGRWIAGMDDDDESTPERIEVLLRTARERHLEFCYGQIEQHEPGGGTELLCEFPPAYAHCGLSASLMHADLRFICYELGDALLRRTSDWSRIVRMMRIGVRMGMIDDVVLHYYPSFFWGRGGSV